MSTNVNGSPERTNNLKNELTDVAGRPSSPGNGSPKGANGSSVHPLSALYNELRDLARRYLSRQRRDHTLQPTALVHEAYLRLARHEGLAGQDRTMVLACAARAMRSVL